MHNIDGKYTLTEIAKELNVVPTFINRIQRETGIGGSIGTKGKAASFDAAWLKTFRIVKALRMIGISFKDIKALWMLEKSLMVPQASIRQTDSSILPATQDDPNSPSIKLILHGGSVYYSKTMDDSKLKDVPHRKYTHYPKLIETLTDYKREIRRKSGIFREELKKIDAELDAVLSADKGYE